MKLWTITTNDDDGTRTATFFTQETADSAFARMVAASWTSWYGEDKPMPEDAEQAYDQLSGEPGFFDQIHRDEFDLSYHPAVREARATLNVALERLQMNDIGGEEAPFIEDCETALKMLEGEKSAEPQPNQIVIKTVELSQVFTMTTEDDREDIQTAAFGSMELMQAAALTFLKNQWVSWFDNDPARPIPTEDAEELREALESEGWGGRIQLTSHVLKGQTFTETVPAPQPEPAPDADDIMLEQHFRDWAKENLHDEGHTEIDDAAIVSLCPDEETGAIKGAYVQAWMWVSAEDADLTTDDMGHCADCGQPAVDKWDENTPLCRDCHMQRQDNEVEA